MGRKPAPQTTSEVFDIDRMKIMMKELWEPSMALLLAKHVEIALKDDKVAYEARKDIFDRYFGKPVETMRQDSKMQINITISPVGGEGKEEVVVLLEGKEQKAYEALPAPALEELMIDIKDIEEEDALPSFLL